MANQPKKYKKFVATAATATLVASAIVPVASAASLSDIKGNTHEEAITSLVDAGVINGYPDGTFQPNKTLTRSDVVKLLGKYLVSKGLEVPADYKTNVRFNDLTSASNDELLKYAAVVYDAGVFSGSNGNLLAGDNITRENMAVVLVRAFDTLNNIDLVSYVQGQEYKKDVKDLFTAKAEARAAIEVLDFFDITNPSVANFNPKGSTTRGQFATFLYKTINTDFSAVTGVANSAVSEIKAVNNTTVEVTFKETVENIESLDFTIEGLEVKNAVVKQTDAKTVVLTTAAQTGETVYTLNVNAAKAGTFKGVSAVIPTAVTMTTASVQGKLGQQVTVKAQVTVAEGQSKAGIPVTLFVPGSADGIKAPVTVEAVTNAEGVATYTYTRYAATTDAVTVYATGDRSKFATGYVFWGVDTILAVEEVTTGATANNGANKTYKVTYKDAVTGKVVPNKTLNVSFLENINVQINQISKATVNGINPTQLLNNSAVEAAQIVTDSKGEALFTVSGENTEVTPVIFDATHVSGNTYSQAYAASLLQTTAPKVKFAALQAEYAIELTRDGGEEAATGVPNGREYKVVVKDKAGNLAKNETVNVAFNEDLDGVIGTQTGAYFIELDSNGNQYTNNDKQITVTTDSKGEASFIVGSNSNKDYATPIAWIDVNSSYAGVAGKLDQGEPSKVGAISYFADAKLTSGALVGKNAAGKKATDHKSTEAATFEFSLANQSGKAISLSDAGYTTIEGNFTVLNDGAEVVVVTANGVDYRVSPNRSVTVAVKGGTPTISVKPETDKTTSVKVTASGVARDERNIASPNRAFTIPTTTAVVAKFTSTTAIGEVYTNDLTAFNTTSKTIKFVGKDAVKYAGVSGKKYSYKNQYGNTITVDEFEGLLKAVPSGKTYKVTYATSGDDVNISIIGLVDGTLVDSVNADLTTAKTALDNAIKAVTVADYKDADKATALVNAAKSVLAKTDATKADYENAKTTLVDGLAKLEKNPLAAVAPTVEKVVASDDSKAVTVTFTSNVNAEAGQEIKFGEATGTIAAVSDKKEVVIVFTDAPTVSGAQTFDVSVAATQTHKAGEFTYELAFNPNATTKWTVAKVATPTP